MKLALATILLFGANEVSAFGIGSQFSRPRVVGRSTVTPLRAGLYDLDPPLETKSKRAAAPKKERPPPKPPKEKKEKAPPKPKAGKKSTQAPEPIVITPEPVVAPSTPVKAAKPSKVT